MLCTGLVSALASNHAAEVILPIRRFWLSERCRLNYSRFVRGAGGGIRTHNPVRGAVFETAAYTVPPRRPACQPPHMMTPHVRRLPA